MTCEKRLLIKKIEEIGNWIYADMELGCGFAPDDAYDSEWEKVYALKDRLAQLRGFKNHHEAQQWFEDNIIAKKFNNNYGNPNLPFYL